MGSTQLRLLRLAVQGPIRCQTPGERQSALRLHDNGYFERGQTSWDYTITEKGLRHGEEQQKEACG